MADGLDIRPPGVVSPHHTPIAAVVKRSRALSGALRPPAASPSHFVPLSRYACRGPRTLTVWRVDPRAPPEGQSNVTRVALSETVPGPEPTGTQSSGRYGSPE